ncbi:MAG TPA: FG-GAP-like repeat-containing protein [Vicinamibacterales bacterium]|nr:FG-GAP-like repeat-containing protein [Vicinamibacterales bacterium]
MPHLLALLLVLALWSHGSSHVQQQQPSAPTPPSAPDIPDALRIQATDPEAAAKILEAVTARAPRNARAWRLLGVALHLSKQYDRAIEAYQKAIAIQPDPIATYNIGAAYARKNDPDRAFEWLAKARATKQFDMTQMQLDPDLEPLRGDPRFTALLPKKEDFANPFVEETRILAEWGGEAMNDQFGWIARAIGDVDKDGVIDFVTCAPFRGGQAQPAGRIYAYSTKSRQLLWKADGAPGDRLGMTLEAAGDANADGIPDVVATGGSKAYVYSGRDGATLLTLTSPGALPLGAAASAGDVNRDGHADVIAGATPPRPGQGGGAGVPPSQAPLPAGNAYVFSGKDGTVLLSLAGERAGDNFGSAVAGHTAGPRMLLIVGAPSAGPRNAGRAYVYTSLTAKPAFVIDADETGAALGAMFVAAAGDVNKDGVEDAYASDFANRAKGPSTGRVYVHSGRDGSRLLTLTGEGPGEGFGTSASAAGDIDGDGHADLAVGAWQYGGAAVSGGRIYLHSGRDGRLLRTITCRIPGDTLGFDSVGIGDTDGDGTVDLLLTSAYSGINGYRSGRVFLVSSGVEHKE